MKSVGKFSSTVNLSCDLPSDLAMREATLADEQNLGEFLVRAFNEAYAKKMPEVVMVDRRRKELFDLEAKQKHGRVLILEEIASQKILGSVTVLEGDRAGTKTWKPNQAEMRFLALGSETKGRGLSAALITSAENVAREMGALEMVLHVRRGAHGVSAMYLKHGYSRSPDHDVDMLPEVFMEAYWKTL